MRGRWSHDDDDGGIRSSIMAVWAGHNINTRTVRSAALSEISKFHFEHFIHAHERLMMSQKADKGYLKLMC